MNTSTEFVNSRKKFNNKDVLLEMITDLFASVRRVISPITRRNSDKAVQLCEVRNQRKLKKLEHKVSILSASFSLRNFDI